MNITEAILSLIAPLRWVLYAYSLSGGDAAATVAMAELLGIANSPEDSSAAWKLYTEEAARLYTCEDEAFEPFRCLCETFSLNLFSRFAVTLALAFEVLQEYNTAFMALGGLTPTLVLRLFSASPGESLGWQADWLRSERLLRFVFVNTNLYAPLRLRPVVSNYILGVSTPPEPYEIYVPSGSIPEPLIECDIPQRVAGQLNYKPVKNIFILSGAKGSGRTYQMIRFAEIYQVSILQLRYDDIPVDTEKQRDLCSFLALNGCFVSVYGIPKSESLPKIETLLRNVQPANLFIHCGEEMLFEAESYTIVPLVLPVPRQNEKLELWRSRLSDLLSIEFIEQLSVQYRFTVGQVLSACDIIYAHAVSEGAQNISPEAVHIVCRRQLTHNLGKLAARANGRFDWDDLILPPLQKHMLKHICDRVRYSGVVYGSWRLDCKACYGRGVHALLSGPPGTGKTMAAQIIAGELGMELFKIDLSSLVSKYIGETEKNLDNVFTEAAKSGGILFFDEADAVFGRRGEQKDSHDKYANLQTAFLLQRFEDYDGVVLLATNLISNLDPAFMRRIKVRVDFPAPDRDLRRKIWQNQLAGNSDVPLSADIDIPFLSETFELTGAGIKNIVMTAAFLSAADNVDVGMKELIRALMMEYSKSDKILSVRELGEYAYYLEK